MILWVCVASSQDCKSKYSKVGKDLKHCLGFGLVARALCCLQGRMCCVVNCWRIAGRKLVHLRWTTPRQDCDPTALTWLQVIGFELAGPNAISCIALRRKLCVTEARLQLKHRQKALERAQAREAGYSTMLQHFERKQ